MSGPDKKNTPFRIEVVDKEEGALQLPEWWDEKKPPGDA